LGEASHPTTLPASTTLAPRPKGGSEEIRRPRPGSEGDSPEAPPSATRLSGP
jgi:hypothetical protein